MDCRWLIGSVGAITLTFDEFALEAGYDFLFAYDGENEAGAFLGKYTGRVVPRPIVASSGRLFLVFTSDDSGQQDGFVAYHQSTGPGNLDSFNGTRPPTPPTVAPCYEWLGQDSACGDERGTVRVERDRTGMITDGTGCAPYRPNSNCTWYIQANSLNPFAKRAAGGGATTTAAGVRERENATLRFEEIDLEYGFDFVQVYDGTSLAEAKLLATFTGYRPPGWNQLFVSESGMLVVNFLSDASVQRSGFSALYSNGWKETMVPTYEPSKSEEYFYSSLSPSVEPTNPPTPHPTFGRYMNWSWGRPLKVEKASRRSSAATDDSQHTPPIPRMRAHASGWSQYSDWSDEAHEAAPASELGEPGNMTEGMLLSAFAWLSVLHFAHCESVLPRCDGWSHVSCAAEGTAFWLTFIAQFLAALAVTLTVSLLVSIAVRFVHRQRSVVAAARSVAQPHAQDSASNLAAGPLGAKDVGRVPTAWSVTPPIRSAAQLSEHIGSKQIAGSPTRGKIRIK